MSLLISNQIDAAIAYMSDESFVLKHQHDAERRPHSTIGFVGLGLLIHDIVRLKDQLPKLLQEQAPSVPSSLSKLAKRPQLAVHTSDECVNHST